MKRRRYLTFAAVVALLLTAVAVLGPLVAIAEAGTGPRGGDDRNRRIAVGDVFVGATETVDGPLIAIDGQAVIDGAVDDSSSQ